MVEVDLSVEGRGEAKHDAAFHLCPHDIRIDRNATVHDAQHPVHANLAVFN